MSIKAPRPESIGSSQDQSWREGVSSRVKILEKEVEVGLFSSLATLENTGSSETEVFTYTIPRNALLGSIFSFGLMGTWASGTGVARRIRVSLGGVTIFDTGILSVTSSTVSWSVSGEVLAVSSTSEKAGVSLISSYESLQAVSNYTALTLDLTTPLDFKLFLTGAATGEVKLESLKGLIK